MDLNSRPSGQHSKVRSDGLFGFSRKNQGAHKTQEDKK